MQMNQEKLPKITQDNWSSTHFVCDPLRAFVSLGAAPGNNDEVEFQYLVTVTDKDFCEVFQSTHHTLEEALLVLNEKYGHWQIHDAGQKLGGDGCSSCAAH